MPSCSLRLGSSRSPSTTGDSGGYAVRAAATDSRVKAVAGIAGAYNSPAGIAQTMGVGAYRSALAGLLDRYDEYVPAVAPDGGEAAMAGDDRRLPPPQPQALTAEKDERVSGRAWR